MRILVIGAGAVGGYFGGRLAQAGRDVTFLVHTKPAASIRQNGLRIVSPHGDATLHPKVVLASEIAGFYDLVLLSVKAYGLSAAIDDFAPAIGPRTMILPVLNGMRHIETLTGRLGQEAVIGGVCLVATEVDSDGRIVQLAPMQQLVYGERNKGSSERMQALHAAMQGAGFDARVSVNITQEMWEKWVLIASLGALTCLLRGNVGEIEATPGGAKLALEILRECVAISTACGHAPSEELLVRTRLAMTAPGSNQTASMYRDLRQGGRVEVDHILGDLLERGRALNVAAPLVEAAFVNLRIYQARRAAEKTPAET
jgi:2-dehydropantoate 2-reductase